MKPIITLILIALVGCSSIAPPMIERKLAQLPSDNTCLSLLKNIVVQDPLVTQASLDAANSPHEMIALATQLINENNKATLQSLDLATPLKKIKHQFSDKEIEEYIKLWERLDYDKELSKYQFAKVLEIVFDHKKMNDFLEHFPDYYFISFAHTSGHSSLISKTFTSVIDHFSSNERKVFRKKVLQRYSGISKEEELLSHWDGKEKGPLVLKRNLEVMAALLSHADLVDLKKKLPKKEIAYKEAELLVNRYFDTTREGLRLPRGNYQFDLIVDVAKTIQKTFSLLDNSERSIEFYGSFPNGKANLSGSDIDLHLSDKLALDYLSKFDLGGYADVSTKLRDLDISEHTETLRTQEIYLETEKAIAQLLKVKKYEPSELMSVMVETPGHSQNFGQVKHFGFYNPIILKITKSQIFLEIWDGLDNSLKEIEILF